MSPSSLPVLLFLSAAILAFSSLLSLASCIDSSNPYVLTNLKTTKSAYTAILDLQESNANSTNISKLALMVQFENTHRLRVKITDASKKRWEVPDYVIKQGPDRDFDKDNSLLRVEFQEKPFAFRVWRKQKVGSSTEDLIFDSFNQPFAYQDQYLSIATNLHYDSSVSDHPHLYGLAERFQSFQLPTDSHTFTMWNKDNYLAYDKNLYGSHPFYMQHKSELASSHGVLLLNSNAMDVIVDNRTLQYKTIGGVLDFFFFAGPSPKQVVQQYQQLTGLSYMPLYSSLGFHMCRYGYPNLDAVKEVVRKMDQYKLPLDYQWLDIDYMRGYRLFTWDPVNFPEEKMKAFVQDLHAGGKQLITIIDPGVKVDTRGYEPYDSLIRSNAFLKTKNGSPSLNIVWPGWTIFPDFSSSAGIDFWHTHLAEFVKNVGISGIWCDMNEYAVLEKPSQSHTSSWVPEYKDPIERSFGFDPNNPPYVPGGVDLAEKTADLDCYTEMGIQYDTHNLNGQLEIMATKKTLEEVTEKRAFIITRSTFIGSGNYSGMWLGDNESTYYQMKISLGGIMTLNMLGVQLTGSDICGFEHNTTQELCKRWTSLGSFYPFMRNHNFKDSIDQEPWALNMTDMTRRHLLTRYSLLPYYYTLFYEASRMGGSIWRPLFQLFPGDAQAPNVDTQVMVGDAIMLSPVLEEGATSVDTYFPRGAVFYNFYTGEKVLDTTASGVDTSKTVHFPVSVDDIMVFQLGGSCITRQEPGLNTQQQAGNPFFLQLAADENGEAQGEVYFDDGETLLSDIGSEYAWYNIQMAQQTIKIAPQDATEYAKNFSGRIVEIVVYGIERDNVNQVLVNGESTKDFEVSDEGVLKIYNQQVNFAYSKIEWK